MSKIFKIEQDELVLDRDYLRGIPEFKVILERDRGSKGDADGRKKFRAWQEFMYIYIVSSFYSYPNKGGYNEKDTHKAAITESNLEEDFKPDPLIKAAIVKNRELEKAVVPTLNTINTVLKGLKISDKISESIIDNIESIIDKEEKKNKECLERGETIDIANNIIITEALIKQLEQLTKIANSLPKTIDTLQDLYVKLSKEEAGQVLARGGKKIGNRAE
jgi:hypothetical protein